MAIAPIAFGDDAARLVREGYEALSRKLNGKTVYRKVISDPILRTQTTKFAILDNSNKVGDIYERVVENSGLLTSPGRFTATNFIKHGSDMTPKYIHVTEMAPKVKMRSTQVNGYFSVHEVIQNENSTIPLRRLNFVSDTKGNLGQVHCSEIRNLPSKYNDDYSSKIYTYQDATLFPKPRVRINKTGIRGDIEPYNIAKEFEKGDILPTYRWRLSSMRDDELYENAARRATGRTL